MGTGSKIAVLVAVVAAAVVAFLLFSGGSGSSTQTTSVTETGKRIATTPAVRVVSAAVSVGASGPTGGVKDIAANAGDRIVITVQSTGYTGEVHLHGFDIHHDVAPGKPVAFVVPASATAKPEGQGSFEMELEATATLIARLRVSP